MRCGVALLLVSSVLTVTTCGSPVLATRAAVAPPWHPNPLFKGLQLNDIACPSATVCFAVGTEVILGAAPRFAVVLSTKNGGVSWTLQYRATARGYLTSIACPTTSTCFTVGQVSYYPKDGRYGFVLVTKDGGRTWRRYVDQQEFVSTVSCGAVGVCYAAGYRLTYGKFNPSSASILMTVDGGAHWQRRSLGPLGILTITCRGPMLCYGAGSVSVPRQKIQVGQGVVVESTNGWRTWRTLFNGGQSLDFDGVDCPTITTCYATGNRGAHGEFYGYPLALVSHDGGRSWTRRPMPPVSPLDQGIDRIFSMGHVTCPSATTCYALAPTRAILRTEDGGSHWQIRQSGDVWIGISCPTVRICYTTGGGGSGWGAEVNMSSDGGRTWHHF